MSSDSTPSGTEFPIDLAREADFPLGASRVSPSTREVLRGTERELLEPRVMQVLVALAQAKGRVVSREELITRCWEGRVVGEDAINRAIGRLRRLSEVDREASFTIETIPRVGYRLIVTAPEPAPVPAESSDTGFRPGNSEIDAAIPPAPVIAVSEAPSLSHSRRRQISARTYVLAASAALAIAACAAWLLWPVSHHDTSMTATPAASVLPNPTGVSIAVLPFLNLSADKDQEFFSDGMTEELTSALAKVQGLTVIGRTSAFQFKGENRDLRAIGRALGAKNLIEGSVRKDGDEVRITVQLIRAEDGTHLWTESYDRELKGIFAVQENIATAIAGALSVPLGLKPGESLVSNRTTDTRTYQDYLRALALSRARAIPEQITVLKALLARDPGYAPAWALLASAYSLPFSFAPFEEAIRSGSFDEARRLLGSQYALIEGAARKAIQLNPESATGYDMLSALEGNRGHWAQAEDHDRRALSFDPNNPEILYGYGYFLAATGRIKEALQVQDRLMAIEPFVPVYQSRKADLLWALGDNKAAMDILQSIKTNNRDAIRLAKVYATQGQFGKAADTLQDAVPSPNVSRSELDEAAKLLRSAPSKVAAPATLPALPAGLSFVYLFIGAPERSLDMVEREISAGYFGGIFRDPWAPPSANLRKTERFKAFVRMEGFDKYWRQRGWPEYCRPVGASDFECK